MGTTEQFGRYGNTTQINVQYRDTCKFQQRKPTRHQICLRTRWRLSKFTNVKKHLTFPNKKTLWYHFRLFHNYLAERPGTRSPLPVHDVDPVGVGGGGLAGQLGLWKKNGKKETDIQLICGKGSVVCENSVLVRIWKRQLFIGSLIERVIIKKIPPYSTKDGELSNVATQLQVR